MTEIIDKTPKSDVIFKIIFGNQAHSNLLIHLLNSIIQDPDPITEIEIKQTELTPEFVGQRGVRLDVLAKTSEGHWINIEIQKYNEHNMIDRSLFHWAKLFSNQAVIGQRYEDLKRTICINIMDFNLFDDQRYRRKCSITEDKTHKQITGLLELHFIELPKIKKLLKLDDSFLLWMEFLINPYSEKLMQLYDREQIYNIAMTVYEKAIADPKVQELIRIREKAEMDYMAALKGRYMKGIEKGRAEERKKAEKELEKERKKAEKELEEEKKKAEKELEEEKKKAETEKIEMAKKFLEMGLPPEQVAVGTGLSVSDINRLKNT